MILNSPLKFKAPFSLQPALFFRLIFVLFTWQISTAQTVKNKDIGEYQSQEDGDALSQTLYKYKLAIRSGQVDSAFVHLNQAKNLHDKQIEEEGLDAIVNYLYASLYYYKSDFKTADSLLDRTVAIAKRDSLPKLWSQCYNVKGSIALYNLDYDLAIDSYQNALKHIKDPDHRALFKLNIGSIYLRNKKLEYAKLMAEEVIDTLNTLETSNKRKATLAQAYLNLSEALPQNDYAAKLQTINQSITLSEDINNLTLFTQAMLTKGVTLYSLKQYNASVNTLKTTIHTAKKNGIIKEKEKAYLHIAEAHEKLDNNATALAYLDSIYKPKNYSKITQETIALYSLLHKKLGQYESALNFSEQRLHYLDSIANDETQKAYIEYGKKYETEKKIQENEILKKENQIKDLETAQQKTFRNYAIIFALLVIALLVQTYLRYRSKKQTAELLETQKQALQKANENKQKLFSIIGHDLINPFNAILGYIKLLKEDYESFSNDERKHFIAVIDKFSDSNYHLTKNLLDWAKVQQEGIKVHKETLKTKALVAQAIEPYLILAQKKNITIETTIAENSTITADNQMMQTVIGNLFVNAIKFTPKQGHIKIYLQPENNNNRIVIEDSGVGMTEAQLKQLFDGVKFSSSTGTENEKGSGLGLQLAKQFMELQNGKLQIFSKINEGSRIVLAI